MFERGVSEVSVTPLGQAIAGQAQVVLIENFTVRLLDMLGSGALVCAILAEPFPDTGLATAPLYDDPFMAPKPQRHRRANKSQVNAEELRQ